jgi:ubiquinone/menaquinone biosynthesis C-methylase UbiE/broad specificity phosphatase PhoE
MIPPDVFWSNGISNRVNIPMKRDVSASPATRSIESSNGKNESGNGNNHFACDLRPGTSVDQPTRLLLACHAENMQSHHQHLTPAETGLSAKGWEQTTALAEWLRIHEEIDVLLADSRLSARLTAQRIGQHLNLRLTPISVLPNSADPSWTLEPPLITPTSDSLEAVARYAAYTAELVATLSRLLTDKWGKTVLLVTDAVTVAALLRSFAAGAELGFVIPHASLSEIVYDDERWALAYTNRSEHLVRQVQTRRIAVAESAGEEPSAQELDSESEQIARFYNQVALRLVQENGETQASRQVSAPDMNAEQILSFAELEDDCHLLFVGVGSGQMALALAQAGLSEVVGIDVSPAMLERAEFLRLSTKDERLQSVNFRLVPAHNLPFSDERFDVALCINLLHHLANPLRTLSELHRILPDRGKLVLLDVDGSADAVKRATQNAIESKRNPTHATIRTGKQLTSLLSESGFQVEKEQTLVNERSANAWLDRIAIDGSTRTAVLEMLEASIETDAAGLHVRREDDDLRFDVQIAAFVARKTSRKTDS